MPQIDRLAAQKGAMPAPAPTGIPQQQPTAPAGMKPPQPLQPVPPQQQPQLTTDANIAPLDQQPANSMAQPVQPQEAVKKWQMPESAKVALAMPPTGATTPWSKIGALTGNAAIKRVEQNEGRTLSPAERRVVEVEGFADKGYYDKKGILTYGVGQTGDWIKKSFTDSFNAHVERAENRVNQGNPKRWDKLPEYLKIEMIQSEYRGDLGKSPKAMRLFRAGKMQEAAVMFLDSDEYRNPKTSKGVKDRMKATSNAMRKYGKSIGR